MLYILTGLPGSGKSTWAKENLPNAVVVCKDTIREEICGDVNDQSKNKEVFNIARTRTKKLLEEGKDVITDATHLTRKQRANVAALAPAETAVGIVWMNTSLKTCLERNAARDRVVPPNVIRKMHFTFERPKLEDCDTLIIVQEQNTVNFHGKRRNSGKSMARPFPV